jgi:hypothetical protein
MKKFTAAIALGLLAVGAQAASTPTYSFGPIGALTSYGVSNPPGSGPALVGTLNLFDTNLGTLTGVTLVLSGSMSTQISATATTASTFQAATLVFQNFSSTVSGLDSLLVLPTLSAGPSGVQNLGAGQTASYGPFSDSESITLSTQLNGLLSAFQSNGPGQFNITCGALGGMQNTILGGNVDLSQVTTASCGASVSYTYTPTSTPVPEPTSLALVGLALAAAGASAARRKA